MSRGSANSSEGSGRGSGRESTPARPADSDRGAESTSKPDSAAQPDLGTDAQRANGAQLYAKFCSQCHGDAGDGKGPAAPMLEPLPRDFTSGKYKIRTTPSGAPPTQQDLESIIRKGMPYTAMPGWPQLTDAQVRDLAYHLKTYTPDFGNAEALQDPIEIPSPPGWTEESAAAGRAVYEGNGCVGCHGNPKSGSRQSGAPIRAAYVKKWSCARKPCVPGHSCPAS